MKHNSGDRNKDDVIAFASRSKSSLEFNTALRVSFFGGIRGISERLPQLAFERLLSVCVFVPDLFHWGIEQSLNLPIKSKKPFSLFLKVAGQIKGVCGFPNKVLVIW